MHQALQKLQKYEKHPPLALVQFGEKGYTLSLRTVDLQLDLGIFFRWMEDPDLQVNWGLKENSQRLDRHYQFCTESENRQSFLVEKSEFPLF